MKLIELSKVHRSMIDDRLIQVTLVLASLFLAACAANDGGGSGAEGQAKNPVVNQDTTPTASPTPLPTPVTDPHSDNDAREGESPEKKKLAAESFAKTPASGQKSWTLRNIVVEYSKKSTSGHEVEKWTRNCTSSGPIRIQGSYPIVNLKMPGFDCGPNGKSSHLVTLHLITHDLTYRALHIPAFPSAPNQFRLLLQRQGATHIRWKSVKSLNALTSDETLFMDLVGEEKGAIGIEWDKNHFITIAIPSLNSRAGEKLEATYTLGDSQSGEYTEIAIKADLKRAN